MRYLDKALNGELSADDIQKALAYYGACYLSERPLFVPSRVSLPHDVRGDYPFGHTSVAPAGDYDADSNQWGAISVTTPDGCKLGVKPGEFDPIVWRENA